MFAAPAFAQASFQVPRGLPIADVRAGIQPIPGVTIKEEQTLADGAVFVVSVDGLPFVFGAVCSEAGANCTHISFLGILPPSMTPSATVLNSVNVQSQMAWLATDPKSGATIVRGATILAGNTKSGLQTNVLAFIGNYAVIGDAILKSGGNTVSLEGVEVSPRERIIDAAHQPASTLGLGDEVLHLISEKAAEQGLAAILSDAQTYARLRKIVNDVHGE